MMMMRAPVAAARVLVALLDDEAELRRAGRAALARFRHDYDADVVVPRLLDLLVGTLTAETEPAAGSLPAAVATGSPPPGPADR